MAKFYYKSLNYVSWNRELRSPFVNFNYTPYLPRSGRPGKWTPTRKRVVLCEGGYHAWVKRSAAFVRSDVVFLVEGRGKTDSSSESHRGDRKIAFASIRLVKCVKGKALIKELQSKKTRQK